MLLPLMLMPDALESVGGEDPEIVKRQIREFVSLCFRHGVVTCSGDDFRELCSAIDHLPPPLRADVLTVLAFLKKRLGESRFISHIDNCDRDLALAIGAETRLADRRFELKHLHLSDEISQLVAASRTSHVALGSADGRAKYWHERISPLARRYTSVNVFDQYALTDQGQSALAWLIGSAIGEENSWCAVEDITLRVRVYCAHGAGKPNSHYQFNVEQFTREVLRHAPKPAAAAEVQLFRVGNWDGLRLPPPGDRKHEKRGNRAQFRGKGGEDRTKRNVHNRHIRFSGGCGASCAITMDEGIAYLAPDDRGVWFTDVDHRYVTESADLRLREAREDFVRNSKATDASTAFEISAVGAV